MSWGHPQHETYGQDTQQVTATAQQHTRCKTCVLPCLLLDLSLPTCCAFRLEAHLVVCGGVLSTNTVLSTNQCHRAQTIRMLAT